jgi:hypothetical protein
MSTNTLVPQGVIPDEVSIAILDVHEEVHHIFKTSLITVRFYLCSEIISVNTTAQKLATYFDNLPITIPAANGRSVRVQKVPCSEEMAGDSEIDMTGGDRRSEAIVTICFKKL